MKNFIKSAKFQRLSFLGGLIAAGLFVFASLSVITDVARLMMFVDDVDGARVFKDMQPFVRTFFGLSMLNLVFCAATFVFFCHSRRKFYLSNFLTAGIFSVFSFFAAVFTLIKTIGYSIQYSKVDTEMLKAVAILDPWGYHYSFLFLFITMFICLVVIFISVCMALTTVFKYLAMKQEKEKSTDEENQSLKTEANTELDKEAIKG